MSLRERQLAALAARRQALLRPVVPPQVASPLEEEVVEPQDDEYARLAACRLFEEAAVPPVTDDIYASALSSGSLARLRLPT